MASIKIAILQKDGEEYDVSTEMDLIEALNYVGFTGSTSSNFSYNVIATNNSIPGNQQMLVYQDCEINSGIELDIVGELVILN